MPGLLEKLRSGDERLLGSHSDDARRMKQARDMLEAARRLAARSAALP
jgi:hypothetical protein